MHEATTSFDVTVGNDLRTAVDWKGMSSSALTTGWRLDCSLNRVVGNLRSVSLQTTRALDEVTRSLFKEAVEADFSGERELIKVDRLKIIELIQSRLPSHVLNELGLDELGAIEMILSSWPTVVTVVDQMQFPGRKLTRQRAENGEKRKDGPGLRAPYRSPKAKRRTKRGRSGMQVDASFGCQSDDGFTMTEMAPPSLSRKPPIVNSVGIQSAAVAVPKKSQKDREAQLRDAFEPFRV